MNVVWWAQRQLGRLVTAPGGVGGQCVDLVNLYVMARGAPPLRRNAVDWALPGALLRWSWEPNGPSNFPGAGAVVVWKGNVTAVGTGPYGHIAVVLAADAMTLLSLDQGWPPGAPVGLVWHSYRGVSGWWTPPT